MSFLLSLLGILLLCTERVATHPVQTIAHIKTQFHQLNDTYDYIIVGGGTSGLTIADRLTEDGTKSVLVIEFGLLEPNPAILLPATGLTSFPADMYNYTSIPQIGLNNQTAILRAGALVGGGTAVNSMYFDRGSKEDYDNWERLGNEGWGWGGMLEYFRKSVTFTPPEREFQRRYNITYNMDAYGTTGPVQSSMPKFVWPTAIELWKGWSNLGVPIQQEGADGHAYGLIWVPASMDPKSLTRSYARTAHYEAVKQRSNYHLLTGYHANKIIFSDDLRERTDDLRAEGVEIQPRFPSVSDPDVVSLVLAKREVILAAGAIGSPLILQRSGVGPKRVLDEAGIDVKVELPGVGQNLQDHALISIGYNFTTPILSKIELSSNATFLAAAMREYEANKTGPITGVDGCMGVFLPLPLITTEYQTLINSSSTHPISNPAPDTDPFIIKGFEAQKKILLQSYASSESATIEVPITGAGGGAPSILLKPLSRGSININTTHPSLPIINFNVLTHPTDLQIFLASFKHSRKLFESDSMASLGPIEISPGRNVTSDADIEYFIRSSALPSAAHPCGTTAMMPRELGGVVSPELLVYGTKALSVVDAGVMPLIPGTHLSATVYAVAEKAADIIKAREKGV